MKIAITTVGSRGDLQPFISLGLGLKKAGYEVLIISPKNEEDFVRSSMEQRCSGIRKSQQSI